MTNTVQQEVKNLQGMMTGGIAKAAAGVKTIGSKSK